jgi:hypothetical protein
LSIVGIDFSLNSPAACVYENGTYHFISYFNYPKEEFKAPIRKAFELHDKFMNTDIAECVMYNRKVTSKDFAKRESEKMFDAEQISTMLVGNLVNNFDITDFALEGFSYGSKGNSFIDMIVYNSFLRQKLISTYGLDAFNIFQPSAVKKLAGKGNCDKLYMINAFKNNVLEDPCLEKNPFWLWIQDKEYLDKKKIPKPLDDMCDSYFIVRSLKDKLENCNI